MQLPGLKKNTRTLLQVRALVPKFPVLHFRIQFRNYAKQKFTKLHVQRFFFVQSKSIVSSINFNAAFSDKTALGTFL